MPSLDPRSRHNRPERVYVVGHRNPDTDSIGAAIGYAELKGLLDPGREYRPARLGDVNEQTTWALAQTGARSPGLLVHLAPRAGDVMREEFPMAVLHQPLRHVGQLMVDAGLDLLPIVDDDGVLRGVLTERALARRYLRTSHEVPQLLGPTSVQAMADVLEGEILAGAGETCADGRVWVLARELRSMLELVGPGDVAVVGDRHDAQLRALEVGISVLVVSNDTPVPAATIELARERGTPVVATPHDSYVAGRMITLSCPCADLAELDPLTVNPRDRLSDIAEDVKDVSYRAAVVVDGGGRPIGLVTRSDLEDPPARKVILVDHAERGQSVPRIEDAEIVEILDHHHIGSIETTQPIRATFDPVGSTCTLVAEQFTASGHAPTAATAGILLAAILSDTVVLSSPTTTPRDEVAAAGLADAVGRDVAAFGAEMFAATGDVSGLDAEAILARDLKAYELEGGQTICIGQVETVGPALLGRAGELRAAAESQATRDGHRLVALMVTDVTERGTHLVVAGDLALAERAFGTKPEDGVIALPGVMSRKKQVAPPLMKVA